MLRRSLRWVIAAGAAAPARAGAVAAAVLFVLGVVGASAFVGQQLTPTSRAVEPVSPGGAYPGEVSRPEGFGESIPGDVSGSGRGGGDRGDRGGDGGDGGDGGPVMAGAIQGSRPFRHDRHAGISCLACHGAGDRHRTVKVRTPRDCAACHHDPRRGDGCATCHRRADLPAGPVPAMLALTVWDSARIRTLPFSHEIHGETACRDCHSTPVTLARGVECAACHAGHHRPAAECTLCHPATVRTAHRVEAHVTCAGSGCHAAEVAPTPVSSRTLCLLCHAAQVDHEPGGDCATCHQIPDVHPTQRARGALLPPGRG